MINEQRFVSKLSGQGNEYREIFTRCPVNPVLTVNNWPYPAHVVFNPAATVFNGKTLLLVRVEDRRGFSHLTRAISADGVTNWEIDSSPTLESDPVNHPEELWGIEDPRIIRVEELNKWAVTYTAYSRGGPLVSMALTDDFVKFERLGPIMPPEDKDAALFPRRINGKWALIHRPIAANYVPGAHIWLSYSDDLVHWGDRRVLMHARRGGWWDGGKIGMAAPPMETPEGWLLFYHGVRKTASGSIYRMGLALLDIDDPMKVKNRSDEWIFGPREKYERDGDVDDVVFPSGWVVDEKSGLLKLYYGAADSCVGMATASLSDLLEYIKKCPEPKDEALY